MKSKSDRFFVSAIIFLVVVTLYPLAAKGFKSYTASMVGTAFLKPGIASVFMPSAEYKADKWSVISSDNLQDAFFTPFTYDPNGVKAKLDNNISIDDEEFDIVTIGYEVHFLDMYPIVISIKPHSLPAHPNTDTHSG